MTAPVFLFTPDTLLPAGAATDACPGDALTLIGAEARHAVTVRRLHPGERVDLVDGARTRLICEVSAPSGAKDRLDVTVVERVREATPPLKLTLVQALAKGGRDEQAIETATEVGVEQVLPWQGERCISQWQGNKQAKGRQKWEATVREAAKQSRRALLPSVTELHSTKQLARWVEQTVQAGGVVALLHEEATLGIDQLPLPSVQPPADTDDSVPTLAVIVGPEGGIGAQECALLENAGAQKIRLGPHVMRTASAGPTALAVLAQRGGLWHTHREEL